MFKHYEKGDPEPKIDQSKLILYIFQFCPYPRRVALILSHHSIKHERIYVNIKNKPDWFLNINPTGKVPMIEQDGQKILESETICRHLDQLVECDSLVKASGEDKIKLVNEWWNKIYNSFHAIYHEKTFTKDQEETYLRCLEDFEKFPGSKFISGPQVGLADFLVYPVMEVTNICMSRMKHAPVTNNPHYPRINAWLESMNGVDAVQKEKFDDEAYKEFMGSFMNIPFE